MQPTTAQSRVVDPIVTTHAQGYQRPDSSWRVLFPVASVGAYGGQVIEFGKEGFRRYNTKRAPGSATKRIQFGYAGKPYAIIPAALEALVPAEIMNDAKQVPQLDLAADAVDVVLDSLELDIEADAAALARTAGNYDAQHKTALVGQARWKGNAANPTADISAGRQAVRASIGMPANTVLLSSTSYEAAINHASVVDRVKYTGEMVTPQLLAKLWNVQTVAVAGSVSAAGANDVLSDVWGDDVIVAYVAPAAGGNRRSAARPSYGYTYSITGMPLVEQPYWDQNARSWVYQVVADRTPVLTGITAGYLIQNAGGAPA